MLSPCPGLIASAYHCISSVITDISLPAIFIRELVRLIRRKVHTRTKRATAATSRLGRCRALLPNSVRCAAANLGPPRPPTRTFERFPEVGGLRHNDIPISRILSNSYPDAATASYPPGAERCVFPPVSPYPSLCIPSGREGCTDVGHRQLRRAAFSPSLQRPIVASSTAFLPDVTTRLHPHRPPSTPTPSTAGSALTSTSPSTTRSGLSTSRTCTSPFPRATGRCAHSRRRRRAHP